MSKNTSPLLDRARDELMSHVVRCDVLSAPSMQDRLTWLTETIEFMAERYPRLDDVQITELETLGRRFIRPAIPHGRGHTARTLEENLDELLAAEVRGPEPSAGERLEGGHDVVIAGPPPDLQSA